MDKDLEKIMRRLELMVDYEMDQLNRKANLIGWGMVASIGLITLALILIMIAYGG